MRDHLKRTCVGAVVAASLGGFVGVAPASARDGDDAPATSEQVATPGCYGYAPVEPGWFQLSTYWSDGPTGDACYECRADAQIWAMQGWQTWCWEDSILHAILFVR